jgi:hypothetical protein
MVRSLLICMLVVVGLAGPDAARAWGPVGHEIVCDLAYRLLSVRGRDLVDEIRAAGDLGETHDFHEACIWPDEVRRGPFAGTAAYHFVNVRADASGFDLARDCAALDCAPVAIQRYVSVVARAPGGSRSGRQARAEALRFLGHFVGDLHQPLHVGRDADRGGNLIDVSWFGDWGAPGHPLQLHKVWDVGILESAGYRSVADAPPLLVEIDRRDVTGWRDFDLVAWTEQSHELAEAYAYRHPDGRPVRSGDQLGEAYFEAARPVAEAQLMKAAVRLAHLLDAAAAGSLPRNMLVACGAADGRPVCGATN